VWEHVFRAAGKVYQKPTLVLFAGVTSTACGDRKAASGLFYCPLDRKIYIEDGIIWSIKSRPNGEPAASYALAHLVAHHVQTLLGVYDKVEALKKALSRRGDDAGAKALRLRFELQADCLAGVWVRLNNPQGRLTYAEAEIGLVGELASKTRNASDGVLDSFAHGALEQRMRWFRKGNAGGSTRSCDVFGASDP
jgi:uncharacterized protein